MLLLNPKPIKFALIENNHSHLQIQDYFHEKSLESIEVQLLSLCLSERDQ